MYIDPESRFKLDKINTSLMTFILGAKCTDGVVLVTDRKITLLTKDGLRFDYRKKLFAELRHVIFGSSGFTGNYELFRGRVKSHVRKNIVWIDDVIGVFSDISYDLNKRYNFHENLVFDVLIRIAYPDTDSTLTHIDSNGTPETVETYKAIGAGAKYAKAYLDKNWNKQMTMIEVAELGYFIIRCIEKFRLEESVGLDGDHPQVWFIPNRFEENEQHSVTKNDDKEATDEQLVPISIRVERRIRKHEKQLAQLFNPKSFQIS
jgi:20S proteasome alpha/beta subunit